MTDKYQIAANVKGDRATRPAIARPVKLCPVCRSRRPKRLQLQAGESPQVEPVFCSHRCAADWGLQASALSADFFIRWDPEVGFVAGEAAAEYKIP